MTVALATTFLTVLCASLAAYAIARLQFPGRKLLARGMIYTYLVPQSLLFIPLFAIMVGVGLTNSLTGLTIAHMGFTIPFCTWLLIGYFMSIPIELEEAALVDGCTRLGVLFRIVLPISLPALAVVAFFSFTLSWNEYLYAIVFNSDPARADDPDRAQQLRDRGRVLLGADHGLDRADRDPAARGLLLLPALADHRPDHGRGQGLSPATTNRESNDDRQDLQPPRGDQDRRRGQRVRRRHDPGVAGRRSRSAQQKLIYWHLPTFAPVADDAVRDQFEEFRKMAGLKENEAAFVPTSNSDLIPRLSAALETGTPPDVVRLYESYVQLYRAQGHMMDVTDVVAQMQAKEGGLFDPCLQRGRLRGQVLGRAVRDQSLADARPPRHPRGERPRLSAGPGTPSSRPASRSRSRRSTASAWTSA